MATTKTGAKRAELAEINRVINKAFKARVKTAVSALKSADATTQAALLKEVQSLYDKGAKKGIFKRNTVNRTKSRLTVAANAAPIEKVAKPIKAVKATKAIKDTAKPVVKAIKATAKPVVKATKATAKA